MKGHIKYILLAATAIVLCACTNEEAETEFTTDYKELPLTATIVDDIPCSRVRYATTTKRVKKIEWKDNDEIKFFRTNENDINKLRTTNTVTDGIITKTSLSSEKSMTWTKNTSYTYRAIYPYDRCTSIDASSYKVNLPAVQKVGVALSTDSVLTDEYDHPLRWNSGTQSYDILTNAERDQADKRNQYSATDYSCCLLHATGTFNTDNTGPTGSTTVNFGAMTRAIDFTIDAPKEGKAVINSIRAEYPKNITGTITGSSSTPNDDATENYILIDFSEATIPVELTGTDRLVARGFASRGANVSNANVKVIVNCTLYNVGETKSRDHTFYKTFKYQSGVGVGANIDRVFMGNIPSYEEYIDLGLGVYWATKNVGATSATAPGIYYAWASTEEKTTWTFATYMTLPSAATTTKKFAFTTSGTEYYRDPEGTSATSITSSKHDIAHVTHNGKWHMPTKSDLENLKNKCTWSWDGANKAYIATSKVAGYTDQSITLPVGKDGAQGTEAYYWSSEKEHNTEARFDSKAWALKVSGTTSPTVEVIEVERYSGLLVRPVRAK